MSSIPAGIVSDIVSWHPESRAGFEVRQEFKSGGVGPHGCHSQNPFVDPGDGCRRACRGQAHSGGLRPEGPRADSVPCPRRNAASWKAPVLGWRWRDSVRALFGSDAREPEFQVAPLLPYVAPVPFWTIYGTRDRFTPATAARRLVSLARRPARRREIEGGNHRLDGHRAQLLTSLKSGLAWLEVPRSRFRRAAF